MNEWVRDERTKPGDVIEHRGGVDWYTAGKTWPRWKRIFHRHRAQTRGWLPDTRSFYIERCPCGAYGPRPWLRRI